MLSIKYNNELNNINLTLNPNKKFYTHYELLY